MNRPWSDWMFRLFKSANSKKMNRGARRAPRLHVEHLEDRVRKFADAAARPGPLEAPPVKAFDEFIKELGPAAEPGTEKTS